jgi:membrane-associated protein
LNVHLMAVLLWVAAVLGDTVNYWLGSRLGPAVFKREDSMFLRKKHLERAHAFFEKYGGRAIILARFVPIVRTFVPFVAGVGRMHYGRFIAYNVLGGFIWIYFFLYAGYWFGGLPFIQRNFKLVILAIIIVSVLPIVWETWQAWKEAKRERARGA